MTDMTQRTLLPDRRPAVTTDAIWLGRPIQITVGYDLAGVAREVFATGPKEGSDLAHMLADLCVIVSVALQYDVPAAALAKSAGTVPERDGSNSPASVVGVILSTVTSAAVQA